MKKYFVFISVKGIKNRVTKVVYDISEEGAKQQVIEKFKLKGINVTVEEVVKSYSEKYH